MNPIAYKEIKKRITAEPGQGDGLFYWRFVPGTLNEGKDFLDWDYIDETITVTRKPNIHNAIQRIASAFGLKLIYR